MVHWVFHGLVWLSFSWVGLAPFVFSYDSIVNSWLKKNKFTYQVVDTDSRAAPTYSSLLSTDGSFINYPSILVLSSGRFPAFPTLITMSRGSCLFVSLNSMHSMDPWYESRQMSYPTSTRKLGPIYTGRGPRVRASCSKIKKGDQKPIAVSTTWSWRLQIVITPEWGGSVWMLSLGF